jgi:hypothetical protein
MKLFHYTLEDEDFKQYEGEVNAVPEGYIEYEATMGGGMLFYKIEDKKVTDIISQSLTEEASRRRVDDFISALNVNLF